MGDAFVPLAQAVRASTKQDAGKSPAETNPAAIVSDPATAAGAAGSGDPSPDGSPAGGRVRFPAGSARRTTTNDASSTRRDDQSDGQHAPGDASLASSACKVGRELALLRLAAHEAFERGVRELLYRLGTEVLARELALAPPDVAALTARVLAASRNDVEPVGIVVAEGDADAVRGMLSDVGRSALPVRSDGALASGDFIVEVHGGTLESSSAFRLGEVLGAAGSSGRLHASPAPA